MAVQTHYTFGGKPTVVDPYPLGQSITTPLPRYIALTRIAIATFFTAYIVSKIGWSWPVVVLDIGFAIYTLYKNFLAKDPLVEAFYDIAGSRQRFEALPEITLDPTKTVWDNIQKISWNKLQYPVCRALTSDGRRVMIIKAKEPDSWLTTAQPKRIAAVMAFVERLGPCDTYNTIIPNTVAILSGYIFHEVARRSNDKYDYELLHIIDGTIKTDLANEFIAQKRI